MRRPRRRHERGGILLMALMLTAVLAFVAGMLAHVLKTGVVAFSNARQSRYMDQVGAAAVADLRYCILKDDINMATITPGLRPCGAASAWTAWTSVPFTTTRSYTLNAHAYAVAAVYAADGTLSLSVTE